ncbi:tRNA uridine-5-carboxymethylaminomethyl(34) synthesis GTPase MnmE [Pseudogemmobacter sp. W21_MBD1_M6]|uniref:tRNA uridine-5-carboxymethylaminomethyl(34) synthesis GTPase MnmE n=1 Tax=Pseudogemmobacter sp. W21_MBD1_M6 TaxID=3240271 RepID=UPI003F97B65D
MDTIYALATARGKAGVAIVRLSGPSALAAVARLAGSLPLDRVAGLRKLTDSQGIHLDDALVLTFKGPHSFTGEDTAELQLHGSQATVAAVLRTLSDIETLRLADPGEFTRRALENGRLDLAQVEGLADLVEAETESQRRQALRVLSGALGDKAERWRKRLIRAAALLEATIDFVDEDVPVDVSPEVLELLDSVVDELRVESEGTKISERIRDGFEVAIVGPPNAGKSTLLNALAGREAAITSEYAGTTRDVIEVRMDLRGLAVTVLDTAGLRETDDVVENIGIGRAIERAKAADLRVFLRDPEQTEIDLTPVDGDIELIGKADLRPDTKDGISGVTGQGVSILVDRIAAVLLERAGRAATATRERHRIAINKGISALEIARIEVMNGPDRAELAAEDLRAAIRAMDALVGRVDVENILDEIFASFCLGK